MDEQSQAGTEGLVCSGQELRIVIMAPKGGMLIRIFLLSKTYGKAPVQKPKMGTTIVWIIRSSYYAIGMSSIDRFAENVDYAAVFPAHSQGTNLFREAEIEYKAHQVPCTGCRYHTLPLNISIPECFGNVHQGCISCPGRCQRKFIYCHGRYVDRKPWICVPV
jgi:predicted aldo/keto reductase-like oxidoreductase